MSDATATPDPQPSEPTEPRGGRLCLDTDKPLVEALLDAFREVLDFAVTIAATVDTQPEKAVHEYRKSIRRSRSVLRMLRPAVEKQARRDLGNELRELVRPTSILRDADVLVETCDSLALVGAAAEALFHLRAQIAAHRDTLREQSEAARILAEGSQRLPALADELTQAVAPDTAVKRFADAFDRTFSRADRARRRALKVGSDDAVHDWRKRVKEVRYQLELLAEPEGGPVEGLRRVYAARAKRLGEITDVIALRHYLEAHADAVTGADAELLDATLAAHIRAQAKLAADPAVEARGRIFELAFGHPPEDENTEDAVDVTDRPQDITDP